MKKLLLLILAVLAFELSAFDISEKEAKKGGKTYQKKFKAQCKMSGSRIAYKHTQKEWEDIYIANGLKKEIENICPKTKEKSYKDKHIKRLFHFVYYYASDTGIVPSCGN